MLSEVKVMKIRPDAKLPTYGSNDAAGADLYACLDSDKIDITPNETVMIPLGIKTEFDNGYAALLYARSGLASKKGLAPANKVGVVDSDYRGEWMVALHNHSNITQSIENGERVAQVVFHKVERPMFDLCYSLEDTDRSEGGFGSTGTK